MGGARNLKLGANWESKGQGTGGNNFFFLCWTNVDIIQLLCASKRCSGIYRGRASGQGIKGLNTFSF